MQIIEAKNISIKIQKQEILHQISITIPTGKRTVILGPNGSGKSTLLKALTGYLTCSTGEIFLDGVEIQTIPHKKLAQRMAILPQGSAIPNDLTVKELVDYGRFPYRKWWGGISKEDEEAVVWAIRQTGLEHLQNRLVKTLSGGERQRTWIAMALAQKPQVLLLDEPTTYLDIAHQLDVLNTVSLLNHKNNISVVMVLHDINHAMQFADEVIIVKDGMIYAQGEPEQVLTAKLLEEVFGVRTDTFISTTRKPVFVPIETVKK